MSHMSLICSDKATTCLYTLSLHDALPISGTAEGGVLLGPVAQPEDVGDPPAAEVVEHGDVLGQPDRVVEVGQQRGDRDRRSEEHTSELQSRENLVCRLLLEKKKTTHRKQR